jgi:uncharacterized protein (TIGR02265 family)
MPSVPTADPPSTAPASAVQRADSRADIKGTLLIARMKYLRARGTEEFERVLRRLSAADQQVLRGMLLPSSWYPVGLLLRLEMTTAAILSRGDRKQLFLDMGRFTAETNLGPTGVQRPYLKEGDPHYLLKNVPRMYSAQHSGGMRTYEQIAPKEATIRTVAGEEANVEDCLTAIGWLKRAIELSGGKIVTIEETSCRASGGDCCTYVCRWA